MIDRKITTYCLTCKAPVFWARHWITQKPLIIDLEPSSDGNIAFDQDEIHYKVLVHNEKQDYTGPTYTNHWATCPDAIDWRTKKRPTTKKRKTKKTVSR